MKIVGLTGGIGSGKSTVLNLFEDLGIAVYIADVEAKKLMNCNFELIEQIKSLFGEQAYTNGKLNRGYISSIVFKDKESLNSLNKLVHPKVREHFQNYINNSNASIVIYETAILFESNNYKMCDLIITVIADYTDRINRIMKRDDVSEEQISERIRNQSSDEFKIYKSHFVVKNSEIESTKEQVKTVFGILAKLK